MIAQLAELEGRSKLDSESEKSIAVTLKFRVPAIII